MNAHATTPQERAQAHERTSRAEARAEAYALQGKTHEASMAALVAIKYKQEAHAHAPGWSHAVAPYAARVFATIAAATQEGSTQR